MDGRAPDRCHLLVHEVNQGMSEAYYTALTELRERLRVGELHADDLVFTVDADGQHDLHVLDELVEMTDRRGPRRQPRPPRPLVPRTVQADGQLGALEMGVGVGGAPLHDVESGYRIFRLGALAHALDYYSGYKYSETVEVAVVLCQLGYKVRNDHVVPVPVARSRTRMRDALIDLSVIPVAAGRVWQRDRIREAFATDAVAHVAIAGILGLLFSLTYVHATDTMLTLMLAAIAAFGLGAFIRRFVPRPSLALLGALLALVAAWLVPQRPDMGSAIVLAALFGVGASLAAPPVRRPRPLVLAGAFVVFVARSHRRDAREPARARRDRRRGRGPSPRASGASPCPARTGCARSPSAARSWSRPRASPATSARAPSARRGSAAVVTHGHAARTRSRSRSTTARTPRRRRRS